MDEPRYLFVYVLSEAVLFGYVAVELALGFTGGGAFPTIDPFLRGAALLVVLVELAVPLAVYADVRRRSDDPDPVWVHAAMMPVANVLGLVAYLEDRRRR